jgi:uncharacterized protein YndB with AHSA1/START domain
MDLSPEEQRRTVISSRMIDAPIDAVFDAYANPEKLVRWWGPNGFTGSPANARYAISA